MMAEHDMSEIADITMRWSRRAIDQYPRWEVDELHNEAFIVAVKLVQAGRYKEEKGKLSTFLWHALPWDVRHAYRKQFGERYLTAEDGKRKYKKMELCDSSVVEHRQKPQDDCIMTILEPEVISKVNQGWLSARISGSNARDLRSEGMSYEEQRGYAEELKKAYYEQHTKRQER